MGMEHSFGLVTFLYSYEMLAVPEVQFAEDLGFSWPV